MFFVKDYIVPYDCGSYYEYLTRSVESFYKPFQSYFFDEKDNPLSNITIYSDKNKSVTLSNDLHVYNDVCEYALLYACVASLNAFHRGNLTNETDVTCMHRIYDIQWRIKLSRWDQNSLSVYCRYHAQYELCYWAFNKLISMQNYKTLQKALLDESHILFVGHSGAGKTTLLNACVQFLLKNKANARYCAMHYIEEIYSSSHIQFHKIPLMETLSVIARNKILTNKYDGIIIGELISSNQANIFKECLDSGKKVISTTHLENEKHKEAFHSKFGFDISDKVLVVHVTHDKVSIL